MSITTENQTVSPKSHITIKGARVHNLKNITVSIPRNKLVVITGMSGSGKSSLAFDTLYAEGQRRYVESLSSYARQFLGRLDKPDVDAIEGISPAIAIEQRVTGRSSRSTVGTNTEIYDYLKLLYARVGRTYSPISGEEVKRNTVKDVSDYVSALQPGTRFLVLAPIHLHGRTLSKQLELLSQQGFSRVRYNNEVTSLEPSFIENAKEGACELIVDRLQASSLQEDLVRLADSVESAFFEGHGECTIAVADDNDERTFSNRFELDGMTFEEPSPNFFSFNNPVGACKRCEGFGMVIGIDENLVVPNTGLSIYEDAVVCWKGEVMSEWKDSFIRAARALDFPIHKPYADLTKAQRDALWNAKGGINAFFKYLEEKSYKIHYRVLLSRYRGRTTCPDCHGTRLRKDASYVKIQNQSISDLVLMSAERLLAFIEEIELSKNEAAIAKRLLVEIRNRLQYLCDVGLGYLTMNRLSNTLSGGESQRISLSTCLGSSLVGSTYILDEPSIGLHPRDTTRLIRVLHALRDLGNTVVVVEHDEEIMQAADMLIDIGPQAGINGGEVMFTGTLDQLKDTDASLTARYLTGRESIPVPERLRSVKDNIYIRGARENNLKNIDVAFPLHMLCVVTGVSGSGKSTLVTDILYPAIRRELGEFSDQMGKFAGMDGAVKDVKAIEFIDQNPIGKSSRSNPVTYVKAWDEVRSIYSSLQISKTRQYKPAFFSFNVEGGRCETCEGEGRVTIEMQFMADITLQCDVCKGKRFKDEILEVKYLGKNISDVLEMSVDEAIEFFGQEINKTSNKKLVEKLQPLSDVGLGYVGLGQSSNTLSGGEAQRIKLASFLSRGGRQHHTLFIFDEPTTGLHFHDVKKLLVAFQALIGQGHSLIVIEHNTDVIKSADWVIDLGPEGGDAGGNLVFEGTPQALAMSKTSYTAAYINKKLNP
ncbi:MAG: excinuclease ABC subunit UvrA [Flavobacteriales bacterium]|nr:excinuclease ABC subunit UvrA [Flavobacteriales bacterium]